MDCPYWTPLASKRQGVLEILAGCTLKKFVDTVIPQGFYTKALSRKLGERAAESWRGPLYVSALHNHLAEVYQNHIPELRHNEQRMRSFPDPFHRLVAGQSTKPTSIQLAPRSTPQTFSQREGRRAEPEDVTLTFNSERDGNNESLDK